MAASPTVLVIDDDEDFRVPVKSLLETYGYQVLEADSGHEGLRMVAAHKPDIILLDVMMENASEGYGVTYSLRHQDEYAACRDIPIIMVSSIEESPDDRFAMSPEAEMIRPDRYLTKPLEICRLMELLKSLAPQPAKVA